MGTKEETGHQTRTRLSGIRRVWPWIKRSLPLVFFTLVLWLLADQAQDIDWQEVKQVVTSYSWYHILVSCGLTMGSYLAYASYDLLGRYFVNHGISIGRTLMIGFICCAFTLNLGSLVGGIGGRYRMYIQRGVSKGDATRIIGLSISTNWLGYTLVAGLVFTSGRLTVPFDWVISNLALQSLGGVFIAIVVAYLALCRFAKTRSWTIRGKQITLPSTTVAFGQLLIASAHWLFMGSVIFSFLYTEIDYLPLLGVLLLSSIAGLIIRVPGALGVLEAVFIGLLGAEIGEPKLVAALIAYRAVFYLFPLSLAAVLYLLNEVASRKNRG